MAGCVTGSSRVSSEPRQIINGCIYCGGTGWWLQGPCPHCHAQHDGRRADAAVDSTLDKNEAPATGIARGL